MSRPAISEAAKAAAKSMANGLSDVGKIETFGNFSRKMQGFTKLDDVRTTGKSMGIPESLLKEDPVTGEKYIGSDRDPSRKVSLERVNEPGITPDEMLRRMAEGMDEGEFIDFTDGYTKRGKAKDLVDRATSEKGAKQTQSWYQRAKEKYDNWSSSGKEKFDKDVDNASKRSSGGGYLKYIALAGVTYAFCEAYAKKNNGCWLVDSNTNNKVVKVSGNESQCNCGGTPPDKQDNIVYKSHATYCLQACESNKDPDPGVLTDWSLCGETCYCVDKQGKAHPHQYHFEWVNMDAWGAFGNILGDIGGKVADITDDILDIVDTIGKSLANFAKYWWVILIVLAVIGAIVAIAVLVPKNSKKNKGVEGGGGGGGTHSVFEPIAHY